MTRTPSLRRLFLLASGLTALVAAAACTEDTAAQYVCTDIPAGGCPLSRGVACEDPECVAVYACRLGNVWELDRTCPAREAGPEVEASVPDAADAAPVFDASVDAPPGAYGGPGCTSLQPPDCPLGVALACATSSSCCECEDLYVCQNGGWTLWGSCTVGVGIRPNAP